MRLPSRIRPAAARSAGTTRLRIAGPTSRTRFERIVAGRSGRRRGSGRGRGGSRRRVAGGAVDRARRGHARAIDAAAGGNGARISRRCRIGRARCTRGGRTLGRGRVVGAPGDQLAQVLRELVYQLAADLDHHAAAELSRTPGHVHRRVHGDLGGVARVLRGQRRADGSGRGAGAAGLLAGGFHHDHVCLGVALGELGGPAVGQRDRAHLDLDPPVDHVAVELVDGGAGHAGRDPFYVKQHVPGLVGRNGHGKGVVELHAHRYVTLSWPSSIKELCPVSVRSGKDARRHPRSRNETGLSAHQKVVKAQFHYPQRAPSKGTLSGAALGSADPGCLGQGPAGQHPG